MRSDRHFGGHASTNNGTNCHRSAIYASIAIVGGIILIVAIVLPTGLTLGLTSEVKASCTKDYECISQNPCIESRCTEGSCEHIDIKNCCVKDQDCGGDVCYKNYCDPKSFTCKLYPPVNGTVCDDYNMCTVNDMCDGYMCKGTPNLCETDNICSFGQCKEGVGCVFSSVKDPSEWLRLKKWLKKQSKTSTLVGLGGNIRSFLNLNITKKMKSEDFIKEVINFNKLDVSSKISAYKLQKDRADVIDFALQIYIEIIKILKVQEIKSNKWCVSDSIAVKTFHELYSKKISISRS